MRKVRAAAGGKESLCGRRREALRVRRPFGLWHFAGGYGGCGGIFGVGFFIVQFGLGDTLDENSKRGGELFFGAWKNKGASSLRQGDPSGCFDGSCSCECDHGHHQVLPTRRTWLIDRRG